MLNFELVHRMLFVYNNKELEHSLLFATSRESESQKKINLNLNKMYFFTDLTSSSPSFDNFIC